MSESPREDRLAQPDAARTVTRMPVGDRRLLMRPHGCFACGELNVSGLHLQLHTSSGRCWAEPVLDERFMGWEGIAHGGIIATILDEVMAWALVDEDSWGLTARMTVEFRRPVPVGRRLRAEGRVVERRRRLIRTEARLIDPETGDGYATAEATYIDAPAERKADLKQRYDFRIEPAAAAEEWDDPWPWPWPWPATDPDGDAAPRRAGAGEDGEGAG
ncbi:MAG: PaaI family thioesterase [Chloroflexi bacterium]|nr:PaaI family thioesterase [Chloroflexota bacterium]